MSRTKSHRVEIVPAEAPSNGFSGSSPELWIRISGFLGAKSAETKRTYQGVLREWAQFLASIRVGSDPESALLSATDIHAMAYRRFLESKVGQRPRMSRSARATSNLPSKERAKTNERRDGLQSTLANATIAKKFSALRRIYRLLIAADMGVTQNPFDTDRLPPPSARSGQKRPTEMVPFEKVLEVLNLPDITTPKGRRDRAALALLFGGGLRRSEVVRLRLGDLRQSPSGTPFVRLRATKAKRDADQALPEWAAAAVVSLVQERLSEGAAAGDYLLVSYTGPGGITATQRPLSDNGLYRLFRDYCLRAGAGEFLTPHSARATAITKLLTDGHSHREVQEFSRHSSVTMVEVYDKRRLGIDDNPGKKLKF